MSKGEDKSIARSLSINTANWLDANALSASREHLLMARSQGEKRWLIKGGVSCLAQATSANVWPKKDTETEGECLHD